MKRVIFVLVVLGVLAVASAASAETSGVWRCAADPANRVISPVYIGKLPVGTEISYTLVSGGYIVAEETYFLDRETSTVFFPMTNARELVTENPWIANRILRCTVTVLLPTTKGVSLPDTMYSYIVTPLTQAKRPVRIKTAWEDSSPSTDRYRILHVIGNFDRLLHNVRVNYGYITFTPYEITPTRLLVDVQSLASSPEDDWPITVCIDDECDTFVARHPAPRQQ